VISFSVLLAFAAACAILALTPGPNMSLMIANTTAHGTRAGFWTLAGNSTGLAVLILGVIFGLGAIMAFVAQWFDLIRLVGAIYLIWLGASRLRASFKNDLDEPKLVPAQKNHFIQAALVSISNPKVLLFLGAFFPQFINLQAAILPQLVLLGIGFLIVVGCVDACLVLAVGAARNALTKTRLRVAERMSAALLMFGGLWLATMKR